MTRVKICGCTSYEDASRAIEAGADAVGFIFAPSERRVEVKEVRAIAERLAPFTAVFGVFVDPQAGEVRDALVTIPGLRLQFSGAESPDFCETVSPSRYVKAFHLGGPDDDATLAAVGDYPRALRMFDTYDRALRGGTGRTFSWARLRESPGLAPFVVSGGLSSENVGACVRLLRPFGVDVRSGVETGNRKDPVKMRAFVRAVREADDGA
ncbi:MAG: phosphoribosylanthranilate isomerase [Candidatus Eremiobacteraeota bacterium]|nr:phosphoribosylanthranilate isomerase [Candidatus Eremiobacteraeota bacterium]